LTGLMAIAIAFGVAMPMTGGSSVEGFTSVLGRDETLTGRTGVWAGVLPAAMGQPILGHGFAAFWNPTRGLLYDINEAHNGYLEIILELGFVGLVLFSMFLLSCCRKAQRELSHDFDWGVLWICFLLMAVLFNASESSLNSFTSHLTAVLLFLAISSSATKSYAEGASNKEGEHP
jgi:exopolysaccharide production protein ExoQ